MGKTQKAPPLGRDVLHPSGWGIQLLGGPNPQTNTPRSSLAGAGPPLPSAFQFQKIAQRPSPWRNSSALPSTLGEALLSLNGPV